MTKQNFTEIIVVLDRSGSMSSIVADMEGGFNTFIEQQRQVPGECRVSLYQFDDPLMYEQIYAGMPISDVPPLKLVPRGSTALYDAVAKTIITTGERFSRTPEWDRPSKVVFMIITDGQENASVEYSVHQNGAYRVKQLVDHQTEKYGWAFVYIGANITTHDDAAKLGISSSTKYKPTPTGARAMYMVASNAVGQYRGDMSAEASMNITSEVPDTGQVTGVSPSIFGTVPAPSTNDDQSKSTP